MKKKYSLSIADVELNVTVDESPATVEYIVGVIDRKMRDILLKSKYCPKTQAALLCALDLCADKVKAKEEIDRLEEEIETLKASLKASDDKYARAQGISIALEGEKARLEIENMKLRALLDEAKQSMLPQMTAEGRTPTAAVYIGPEGGYDTKKVALAEAAQIPSVNLGRRILRCETASGFVLACLVCKTELS